MRIEEQIVSLELAKQLKDIGVKQDSWLYWHVTKKDGVQLCDSQIFRPCFAEHRYIETEDRCVTCCSIEVCSAFTFAEICSMLPMIYEFWLCYGIYIQIIREEDGTWNCNAGNYFVKDKKIVDAQAKILIYLLSEDCHYDGKKFLEWKNKLLEK